MAVPVDNDGRRNEELIEFIVGRWRMLLAGGLAGIIVGLAIWGLSTPIYRAEVILAPAMDDTGGMLGSLMADYGALASLAGINVSAPQDGRQESLAVLRSRALAEAFINEQELMKVFFVEDWDNSSGRWMDPDPDEHPSMWDAFELFDEDIRSVSEDRRTGLITLSMEWSDPEVVARWANLFVSRANEQIRQRTIEEASRTIDYLRRELAKSDLVEVRQAISKILEGQVKTVAIARVREQYAFRVVDQAVPADRDRPVRPRLALTAAVGLLVGLAVTAIAVMLRHRAGVRRAV